MIFKNNLSNEIFTRMKTFVKRGNINAPRNWIIKSNLQSMFGELFNEIENIGFLKAQEVVSLFMGKPDYEKMMYNSLSSISTYSGKKNIYVSLFNDKKYQNEKNVTEDLITNLKTVLLNGYTERIIEEGALLNEAYEAAEHKFKKSRAKNPEKPNESDYQLKVEYHEFEHFLKLLPNDFIPKIQETGIMKEVLSGKSSFYLFSGAERNCMFAGTLGQVIYAKTFLEKSRAFSYQTVLDIPILEKLSSLMDNNTEIMNDVLAKENVKIHMLKHKDSFSYKAMMDEKIMDDFLDGKSYLFDSYKFSDLLCSLEGMLLKENGKSKASLDNEMEKGSTDVMTWWSALNANNVTTPDIQNYKTFFAYKCVCDGEFYKSTLAFDVKKLKNASTLLDKNLAAMNRLLEIEGLDNEKILEFNQILYKAHMARGLEDNMCYNEEKKELLKTLEVSSKERVSKMELPMFLVRDQLNEHLIKMPTSGEFKDLDIPFKL